MELLFPGCERAFQSHPSRSFQQHSIADADFARQPLARSFWCLNKESAGPAPTCTFCNVLRQPANADDYVNTSLSHVLAARAMQLRRGWPKLEHLTRDHDSPFGLERS